MKKPASIKHWIGPLPSSKRAIALFEPRIPQNTGNIIRSCAAFGFDLILIEPLGFQFSARQMKRAGLDHHDKVEITRLPEISALFDMGRPTYLLTSKCEKTIDTMPCEEDAIYLFGSETDGLPPEVMERYAEQCYTIAHRKDVRCLNLSNAVAIVLYSASLSDACT